MSPAQAPDTPAAQPSLSPQEFAARIKAKYPVYANLSDDDLVSRMLAKYPQYRDVVQVAPMNMARVNGVQTGVAGALAGAKEGLTETGLNPVAAATSAYRAAPAFNAGPANAAAVQAAAAGDLRGTALNLLKADLAQHGVTALARGAKEFSREAVQQAAGNLAPLQDASAAFTQGDYKAGAYHLYRYLLHQIGLGNLQDEANQEYQRGEHAKALAHVASFFTGAGLAGLLGARGEGAPKAPPSGNTAEVVRFAQQHDIPLDAATASDNKFVRGAQALADNSLGGSIVAKGAEAQRNAALQRTAEGLANDVGQNTKGLTVGGEGAGTDIRQSLTDAVRQHASDEADAYERADALARANTKTIQTGTETTTSPIVDASGKPITTTKAVTQTFQAPIDMRAVQRQVKPLYDDLSRQAKLVPLHGAKARALVALDRIMHAGDFASLPVADQAAGDLGAMAGRPEFAELRNAGQGAAAKAFSALRGQVDRTAASIPGMSDALTAGRAATTAKYDTSDLLDQLTSAGTPEPVAAYNKLTRAHDASIALLRKVQATAPEAVRAVGQAKLKDVAEKLGLGGNVPLDRAQGALRDWQALGPETKRILMGSQAQADAVDRFFRLTAKIAEKANPSRTEITRAQHLEMLAHAGGVAELLRGDVYPALAASGYTLSMTGLAKLLHSPLGVKLLTRGLMLPPVKAVQAAWLSNLADAARASGVNLIPVTAQAGSASTTSGPRPK